MMLFPPRRVGSSLVFRDDADPLRLYALPAWPSPIADLDEPALHLVRAFLPDPPGGSAPPGPARLGLAVGLRLSEAEQLVLHAVEAPGSRIEAAPLEAPRLRLDLGLAGAVEVEAEVAGDRIYVAADLPPRMAEALEEVLRATSTVPVSLRWTGTLRGRLAGGAFSVQVDEALLGPLLDQSPEGDGPPPGFEGLLSLRSSGSAEPPDAAALARWAWAELRGRRGAGEPLCFDLPAGLEIVLPVLLEQGLPTLEPAQYRIDRVDLSAEEALATRELELRLLADPAAVGLNAVELQVRAGGEERLFRFTAAGRQRWSLPRGAAVRWQERLIRVGGAPGPWSAERSLDPSSSAILLPLPAIASRELDLSTARLRLGDRWARIEVELRWEGPTGELERTSILLDPEHPAARWRSTTGAVGPGRLFASARFYTHGGAVAEEAEAERGRVWLLADPLPADLRSVQVLASGPGWTADTLAWVDLEFADGGRSLRQTLNLPMGRGLAGALEGWAAFSVPTPAGAPLAYRWRAAIRRPDGRFEQRPWAPGSRSTLLLDLPAPAGLHLQVLPIWFDAADWTELRLRLRPTGGPPVDLQLHAAATVEQALLGELPLRWEAIWIPEEGEPIEQSGETSLSVLILPRPQARST